VGIPQIERKRRQPVRLFSVGLPLAAQAALPMLHAAAVATSRNRVAQLRRVCHARRQQHHDRRSVAQLYVRDEVAQLLRGMEIPSYEENADMPPDERRAKVEDLRQKIISEGKKDLGLDS
jgi:hypothetical protein